MAHLVVSLSSCREQDWSVDNQVNEANGGHGFIKDCTFYLASSEEERRSLCALKEAAKVNGRRAKLTKSERWIRFHQRLRP